MTNKRWLRIHFTDGTDMQFDFIKQDHDPNKIEKIMEKAVKSNQLILEVEGVMYMFPYSNIKYIRVSPCPENLPDTAIRGVTIPG
jgi:hypothetical protein